MSGTIDDSVHTGHDTQHTEHNSHRDHTDHINHVEQGDTSTQDAIIDVLAHLQPQPSPPPPPPPQLTPHISDGLDGWRVADLREEIVRLREILRGYGHTDLEPPPKRRTRRLKYQNESNSSLSGVGGGQESHGHHGHHGQDGHVGHGQAGMIDEIWTNNDYEVGTSASRPKRRRTRGDEVKDMETGKRITKPRRHDLQLAMRQKMRAALGINEDDRIPAPTMFSIQGVDQVELTSYGVPNWVTVSDPCNGPWIDRMAAEIIEEASQGQLQIPAADLDPDIVKLAAKTAFAGFAKRFMEENDPKRASQKEKYQKLRRRWARKDLKQKKRAKAAADPECTDTLPPVALHIDYMSSEYSSQGEDSDPEEVDEYTKLARGRFWAEQVAAKAAEAPTGEESERRVWGKAQGEKVLEIRTPRWRSQALNDIYARLDRIAAAHSADRAGVDRKALTRTPKSGHVAPSHSRFVLQGDFARKGKKPKQDGDGWMWKSGEIGVWPTHPEMTEYAMEVRGDEHENDHGDWREEETGALVSALQGIAE